MVKSMGVKELLINRVLDYLDLMDKDYVYDYNSDKITIYETMNGDKIEIYVYFSEKWVTVRYNGPSIKNLNPEQKFKIMYLLLRLNEQIAEAKFCLTEDEHIVVTVESNIEALTFDNFKMEYGAIPYAIRMIKKKIMPIIKGKEEEEKS